MIADINSYRLAALGHPPTPHTHARARAHVRTHALAYMLARIDARLTKQPFCNLCLPDFRYVRFKLPLYVLESL